MEIKLTDYPPMPVGPYKGIAMTNVPPDYLLQMHYHGCENERVKAYILDNLEVLTKEVDQQVLAEINDEEI